MSASLGAKPQDDTLEQHGRRRTRVLIRNVLAGFASRVASAAVTLVTVPLTVALLGRESYGTYVTITAIAGWTQVGALGVGKGLMNVLVDCSARNADEEARRYVASLWGGIATVLGVTGVLFAIAFPFVRWDVVLAADARDASELAATVAVTVAFTLVNLLLSPASIILTAYQEERKASAWMVAKALGNVLAILVAHAAGARMVGLAWAVGVSGTAIGLANAAWVVLYQKPWLRPRRGDMSWALVRRVLPSSATFFAIDVAALFVFQLDKFLLIRFAGPAEVADYDLATRVFLLANSVLTLVLNPLWPAFGEAMKRGDAAWSRKALKRISTLSAAAMAALTLVAVLYGKPAIRLWAHNQTFDPNPALFAVLGAYFAVRAWTDSHTILLFSADEQRAMLWVAGAHAIMNVALAFVFGPSLGAVGVSLASLLAYLVTATWYVPWRANKTIARVSVVS